MRKSARKTNKKSLNIIYKHESQLGELLLFSWQFVFWFYCS